MHWEVAHLATAFLLRLLDALWNLVALRVANANATASVAHHDERGIKAGASVRAVLEMFGIQDCLSKVYGSSNGKNAVKATFDALEKLRSRETIEMLRGCSIAQTRVEVAIKRGAAFMPTNRSGEKMAAPQNTVDDGRNKGRAPRRGGSGGGGSGGSGGGGGGRRGRDDAPAGAPPA